jgi:O-antigen/teichoic acid export membrane protein
MNPRDLSFGPMGMILQARGREKSVIKLNVTVFTLFLIVASVLIPLYEMNGAAISIVLAKLIRTVTLLRMLRQSQPETTLEKQ